MSVLDAVKNFAKVQVSTGYDADDTSIVLAAGEGAKLPAPSTDGNFNLVWWNYTDYRDPSDDPNKEIVRVTARTTDTLTVVRPAVGNSYNGEGSENTASTKNTGGKTYMMALVPTYKILKQIADLLEVPVFSDGGMIKDNNGNELVTWDVIANAVNNLQFGNAATGGAATIEAVGGDDNISINVKPKGTGKFQVNGNDTIQILQIVSKKSTTDNTWTDQDTAHNVLEAAITPKSTSSKFLVLGYTHTIVSASGRVYFEIRRSTSSGVTNGTLLESAWWSQESWGSVSLQSIDAPATTSQLYYALVFMHADANSAWHTNQYTYKGIIVIEYL